MTHDIPLKYYDIVDDVIILERDIMGHSVVSVLCA